MKYLVFLSIIMPAILIGQSNTNHPKWDSFNYFIGEWEGEGIGKFGKSKVTREYSYLMNGTYLIGKNKSDYSEQEKNQNGEIHINWDIFSYDKVRGKFVLRQFHEEDITNTFTLDSIKVNNASITFESESIENFGVGWKAKEVYKIVNENKFVEIFYLAAPGKDYSEFVRNTFKRK